MQPAVIKDKVLKVLSNNVKASTIMTFHTDMVVNFRILLYTFYSGD